MERRNATAAVIGAGDFIGSAIAQKFAAEGFTVFAGRRNGEKLAPLVQTIETAGGRVFARSLDARQEDDIAAFLREADAEAPLAETTNVTPVPAAMGAAIRSTSQLGFANDRRAAIAICTIGGGSAKPRSGRAATSTPNSRMPSKDIRATAGRAMMV